MFYWMVLKESIHLSVVKKEEEEQAKRSERSMESESSQVYFVFMSFDPEYERLKGDRSKQGARDLDVYLSKKHDEFLKNLLEPKSYMKKFSLVIVDGFAVEITDEQADLLRSSKEVRLVEKNLELS